MDQEKFIEIMDNCDMRFDTTRGTFRGLEIMGKYIPNVDISAANHDIIYASCDVEKLLKAGITEEDAIILSGLCWLVTDTNYIAKYV